MCNFKGFSTVVSEFCENKHVVMWCGMILFLNAFISKNFKGGQFVR